MGNVTAETFATLAETTTTADPGTSGTSLACTTRTPFPQSGQFRIIVQNSETDKTNREVMLVTGGFGTGAGSLTVVRGREGTTGVAHPSGSYVACVFTAESINRWVNDYVWQPRHHKLYGWTYDPILQTTVTKPTAGVVYMGRINIPETITIGTVNWFIQNAGSGCANCYFGVFNSSGTRIGATADLSSTFNTAGYKSATVTVDASQSLTVIGAADQAVWVGMLIGSASTIPDFVHFGRDTNTGYNLGLAASDKYRFGSWGSGLSAMPTTVTLTSLGDWYGYCYGIS